MQESPKPQHKKDNKQQHKPLRNKKKVDFSKEFDDFKLRIQTFENKNEEIINHIRNAYAEKKKAIQSSTLVPLAEISSPQLFFDPLKDADSASDQDYSKKVEEEVRRRTLGLPAHSSFYDQTSSNYKSTANIIQQRQNSINHRSQPLVEAFMLKSSKINSPTKEKQKTLIKYEEYMKNLQVTNRSKTEDHDYQAQELEFDNSIVSRSLKRTAKFVTDSVSHDFKDKFQESVIKNLELQQQLELKEQQIQRIKGIQIRFKSYINSAKHVIEDQMQHYQEVVVADKLTQIDKCLKKLQTKLKSFSFRLKDTIEDRKANKLIRDSREKRRSVSITKGSKINSLYSIDMKGSSIEPGVRTRSIAPSPKRNDSSSKNKEFQKIAAGYEIMIKTKVEQNEKLERQLREESLQRQASTSELQKLKAILEQRQKEINDLKLANRRGAKEESKDSVCDLKDFKAMKDQIAKFQEQIKSKQSKEKELCQQVQKLQKFKKATYDQWTERYNKTLQTKNNAIQQLQAKNKQIQQIYEKQMSDLREKLSLSECRNMEKDCELLALTNRLKKSQSQSRIKEEKLKELQLLLLKQNERGENLQKSVYLQPNTFSHTDVRTLQQIIKKLDEQVEDKSNQIYELQKQKYIQEGTIRDNHEEIDKLLKAKLQVDDKVSQLQKQIDSRREEDAEKDTGRLLTVKNQLINQFQTERQELLDERKELIAKHEEMLEELNKIKQENLTKNRDIIKLTSDLSFNQEQCNSLGLKYRQLQQKFNELKLKFTQLQDRKAQHQKNFTQQIEVYTSEIQNLKSTIIQLGAMSNLHTDRSKEDQHMFNSIHISDISFNGHSRRFLQQEVNFLKEKLKQVQTAMQIKVSMQKEVENEYKNNLNQIRNQIAEKNRQMQKYRTETERIIDDLKLANAQKKKDESKQTNKQYEERIAELQTECAATKESEEKLNQMLNQLVETMKVREDEFEQLAKELHQKEKAILQLKELLQIRDIKNMSKEGKEDRSMVIFNGGGDDDMGDLSFFSNISQVFKRDDIIQEKIKRGRSNREEQAKMFIKTSAYIKSLKNVLDAKEKRIRLLQRQITNLKSQGTMKLSVKQTKIDRNTVPTDTFDDIEQCNQFRDYDSLQLDNHGFKYVSITKQLQHEKDLAVQQNIVLTNQVERLQDEIAKGQEQQASLLQMKDLYKDEIRKLMAKNEKQTQDFQMQIKKMREEIEQSDAYHNWQAIKQLVVKIISSIGVLDDPNSKNNKKQLKRKQLEEYVKVACSVLRLDTALKDKLISGIKR